MGHRTDTKPTVRRSLRVRAAVAGLAAVSVLATACDSGASDDPPADPSASSDTVNRGELVSTKHLWRLSPEAIAGHLREDGYASSGVRYGADAYRLTYRTVDASGKSTTATGLVVLPASGATTVRPVVYLHGTMSGANEAPSVDDRGRSDEGMLMTSAGYATVAPDYVGLGLGPGHHPYLQVDTETSAATDLLSAADEFATTRHRNLRRDVLVAGFSQGGQAALAVGKALTAGDAEPFRAAAVAGVSGPYDIQRAEIPAVLDGSLAGRPSTFYLSYLLVSWDRVYDLYDSPADVFRAPYDRRIPRLFDGNHNEPEIFPILPSDPTALLTHRGLAMLDHPDGAMAEALAANDTACTNWAATAPIRLYVSRADEQVAAANTDHCRAQLDAAGLHPAVVNVGHLHHFASGAAGLTEALRWFLSNWR